MTRRLLLSEGLVTLADHAPVEERRSPALLLHGFTGDKTSFEALVPALARERRVIVPDLPGHGDTRLDDDRACSLPGAAALLAATLAELGIARVSVVGYSMGGRLALQLALALPDVVERLVLVSASAGLATEEERRGRREQDEELARFIEDHPIADFVARWEALPLFATERALPADVRVARRRQRLRTRPAGLAASLRGMGSGAQSWLGDRLSELPMPVLVVAGARDRKFATRARDLAAAIPDATLAIVEGTGHAVHLEQPEACAALLREFLEQRKEDRCRSTG